MNGRFLRLSSVKRSRLVVLVGIALAMGGARFWFFGPPRLDELIGDDPRRPAGLAGSGTERVIERDGKTLLWGGRRDHQHFDISRFRLDPDRLHHGLGREHFPALIEPAFEPAEQADRWLRESDRVLAVHLGGETRVYPLSLLTRHEVVNDRIAGVPIFAAYCILADLGAVYRRRIGGQTLTFALSGYTYVDPDLWEGRDAFVLWDRETESLWWPVMGKAVSGPSIDAPLPLLDKTHWSQTTWAEIRREHPDAAVLRRGQDFDRPTDWPKLDSEAIEQVRSASGTGPAPRWGENAGLDGKE